MGLLRWYITIDAPEFKELERFLKLAETARLVKVEKLCLAEINLRLLVQGLQEEVSTLESLLEVIHAHIC
jgi:hypothetical protein